MICLPSMLFNHSRLICLAIFLSLVIFACGGGGEGSSSLSEVSCPHIEIPNDQMGSFMARVEEFPVTVLADSRFTAEERQGIDHAIQHWNDVGQYLSKHNLFNLNYGDIPASIRKTNPTDCQQNFGGNRELFLVREVSESHWGTLGLTRNVPGATFRCERGAELIQQVILIFPEIVRSEQLSSVFVHEFGHAIGLDHSCLSDNAGRTDFRSCSGLDSSHPYRQAVMYPWLHLMPAKMKASGIQGIFGMPMLPGFTGISDTPEIPEVKDTLRSNDYLRAQCVLSSS